MGDVLSSFMAALPSRREVDVGDEGVANHATRFLSLAVHFFERGSEDTSSYGYNIVPILFGSKFKDLLFIISDQKFARPNKNVAFRPTVLGKFGY